MGTMRDKPAADQPQRAPASGPANPSVDQKTQVFGAAIPAPGLDMMRAGDKGKDNAAVFTATVPGLPAGSVKPAASPRAMTPMPETPRRGGGTDIEI
jgi:hypothetical protein